MALRSPRIEFTYASIKQLDNLVSEFPSVDSSTTITNIDGIVDAENTVIGGLRTTAKAGIDAELLVLESQYPFPDLATFQVALAASGGVFKGHVDTVIMDAAQMKTDIAAEIPATGSIADYQAAITAAIQAEAQALDPMQDAETCGHCGGSGGYPANQELTDYRNETLFDTSTDEVVCRTCLSNGITPGQFLRQGSVTSVARAE